jgi:DNA modification methylase
MIFTDPPYGMNAVSKSGVLSEKYKTDIMNDDTNEVAIKSFKLAQQLYPDIIHIWFGANYFCTSAMQGGGWLIWDKNNGASDQADCELAYSNFRSAARMFTMASEKKNRVHPTQKPIKLYEAIFNKFKNKGTFNRVLDLFGGGGSTLIYCEQTGRKCYMMELDPYYCQVVLNRWSTMTGQKPIKL